MADLDAPCRWAPQDTSEDNQKLIDLPVSEQVARGQTLLSMLQGPPIALEADPFLSLGPPPDVHVLQRAAGNVPAVSATAKFYQSGPFTAPSQSSSSDAVFNNSIPPPPSTLPPPPPKPVPPPPPGFAPRGGAEQRRAAAQAAAAAATSGGGSGSGSGSGASGHSGSGASGSTAPPRQTMTLAADLVGLSAPPAPGRQPNDTVVDEDGEECEDWSRMVQASLFDDEPRSPDSQATTATTVSLRSGLMRPPGMWPSAAGVASGKMQMRAEAAPYVPSFLTSSLDSATSSLTAQAARAVADQQPWQVPYPVSVPAG